MKKLVLFATLLMFASGCYTVVEVRRSYPDYRVSRFNNASPYTSDLNDTTVTTFDAYRTGYQDGQLDYVRFRDELRWLRWNQWRYWGPGFGTSPLFWSYYDFFWDPYFFWPLMAMPRWQWQMSWYGLGWGGIGGGWNFWGWGNWAWYPPVVVIKPGNGVTENRVRGPRSSGRTTVGQVNVVPSMASPTLTPGLVNPATFGPTGVVQTGKDTGEVPGRRARSVEGSTNSENATRGSNVSTTERSNASGWRGSGRHQSSPGSVGKSSSSGSTSSSGSSGRRPRGN